ncbi:MAG: hypothetical protein D6712_16320 [Chloroflexi bacterium]|nr:MAG: hypothetical protein D6712_16320 [Chloroflexota bacterium]
MLDFSELLRQFSLGNAAILTNACMLPLYPGLIAFLAGNAQNERARKATALLGVLVLAGVLTAMLIIGMVLYLLQQAFASILPVLLPLIYAFVIILGIWMLRGRNPFARLSTAQAPVVSNPYAAAYVYGLFFGPMTLPCTGPVITSAFLLGAAEGGSIFTEIIYVLGFGVGFGWPLLVLPLIAVPLQRRVVGWLGRNHTALTRASGVLLVAVGVFGVLTEWLPQYITEFDFPTSAQFLYWLVTAAITLLVGYMSLTPSQTAADTN